MFNRTFINQSPRHVSHHHEVREQRAPTDESVRLLREMEAAAMDSIIARGSFRDTLLEGEWVVVYDPHTLRTKAICRFSLNGREERVEVELEHREVPDSLRNKLVDAIHYRLAAIIALKFTEHPGNLSFAGLLP